MGARYQFTSESVTEGHPDKLCDAVSDAILDAILTEDPNGRVACETLLTTGLCVVAGEITTNAYVDIPKLAREVINGIGYDNALYGFDGNTCGVIVSIDEQSPNIGQGVDRSEETRSGKSGEDLLNSQGAGDQGMMFGYACDETVDLMVANDVSEPDAGFEVDTNRVMLLHSAGDAEELPLQAKSEVADAILDRVRVAVLGDAPAVERGTTA